MEDLYDDLENYEYEKVVSELKNENQELKCKLEEHASSLASIQKDFDKLTTEYKKLELNYSSLLKTARAEIERKSQLITNLNIEKDKLVINSMRNRGRVLNKRKQHDKEDAVAKEEHFTDVPNTTENNVSGILNNDRKDTHDTTPFPLSTSVKDDHNTKEKEQKYNNSDDLRKNEKNRTETKKNKENYSDDFSNLAVTDNVSKITNRRKSVPLLNQGDFKFSSDEDQDDIPKDHYFRRKSPLRDTRIEIDRVHYDKYYNGRNGHERKAPEHTRVGDKHISNYDSSRYAYCKSNSRYRESDRYKSRDTREKYESYHRSKRYYSPDRPYNMLGAHYRYRESNERPNWYDNVRHRTLVSPPPERYNPYRSRDFDGVRYQQEGVYSMKHKIHDVIEEPARKRLRHESLNRQPDRHMSLSDRDVESRANSMSTPVEIPYFSLQSPDYVHLENNPPIHLIKEIKTTSDIKLDDPRLTSKKYIPNNQGDKVVLSTVVGRDVDIKIIDKTKWNMDKDKYVPEMPTPLKEKPPISEDLVKDIYMSIDNPISNLSLESGEICLEEDMGLLSVNKDISNLINLKSNNSKSEQSRDQTNINEKEKTDVIDNNQKISPTILSQNYKISKMKKSNSSKFSEEGCLSNTTKESKKRDHFRQDHKNKYKEKKELEQKLKPESKRNEHSSEMFFETDNVCENKKHKSIDMNYKKERLEEAMISARDTVEGDLELSDETSDYTEVPDQSRYDKDKNTQKPGECNKKPVIDSIKKYLNKQEPEKSVCIKQHGDFEHAFEPVCENKHFNISFKGLEVPDQEPCKLYKEQKSKDIKSKLCDLFGDTSSLITLDDLGIGASNATKENINEYAPLFDNTQDAVDLNVEEMEKVQTRSMKLNCAEDEPIEKDANQKMASDKSEKSKCKISINKDTDKFINNVEKPSSIHNIFENVNEQSEDNNVVKTVIISTGIQNNCHSIGAVVEREQSKQPTIIQKTNDNVTSCPALLDIKALATSTPYKPQIEPSVSVPEVSNQSSNNAMVKDVSNISSNTESNCHMIQSNSDIPDVRIIVKRRRKAK